MKKAKGKPKKRAAAAAIAAVVTVALLLPTPVSAEHWAAPSLAYASQQKLLPPEMDEKLIKGKLDKGITREELIALLTYALGEKGAKEAFAALDFPDKRDADPALSRYLGKAYELGIFSGTAVNKEILLLPKNGASRQEAATIISQSLGLTGDDAAGFTDDGKIGAWAMDSVASMKQSDLLAGYPDQTFRPKEAITWGQILIILKQASENGLLTVPEIKIIAGSGFPGSTLGSAEKSSIYGPAGIAKDNKGTLYLADAGNNRLCTVGQNTLALFAGVTGPRDIYNQSTGGYSDGPKAGASFNRPLGIYVAADGILVADSGNNAIRLIQGDQVYTYAGTGKSGYQDGDRRSALFSQPTSMAADENGNVYISDTSNHVIRMLDTKGKVSTVAGEPGKSGYQDGSAGEGLLCEPKGIAFHDGGLYIADSGNQRIRLYSGGKLTTLAGGGTEKYDDTPYYAGDFADGEGPTARFNGPENLAFDSKGNLYIADVDNSMIRKYADGKVTTLLGNGCPVNQKKNNAVSIIEPCGILPLENEIIVTDRFSNYVLSVSYQQQ